MAFFWSLVVGFVLVLTLTAMVADRHPRLGVVLVPVILVGSVATIVGAWINHPFLGLGTMFVVGLGYLGFILLTIVRSLMQRRGASCSR